MGSKLKALFLGLSWIIAQSALAVTQFPLLSKSTRSKSTEVHTEHEQDQEADEFNFEDDELENDDDFNYEKERSRTKWSVMANVAILSGTKINGLTVAKYLDKNRLLEGSAVTGHQKSFWGLIQSANQAITMLEGRLRQFYGNTFNGSIGLGWKSHKITSNPNLKTDIDYVPIEGISASASAIVGGLSIGNQVQDGRLILGCDWIGVYKVIKLLGHRETADFSYDPLAEDNDKLVEEKLNYLSGFRRTLQRESWLFFRLYVGMAF